MGYSTISMAPAVWYTICYALFSSLVAPFVGFFASGFKRAVGIKDFAATLPGHGGFIDRLDCISIMSLFNYFFITQVILKDQVAANDLYDQIESVLDQDKKMVANVIA